MTRYELEDGIDLGRPPLDPEDDLRLPRSNPDGLTPPQLLTARQVLDMTPCRT